VPENLRRIRRAVRTFAERVGAAHLATPIVLAVGEAVLNVMEHAYSGRPGVVTVRGEWQGEALTVLVADQGQWRAPVERGGGAGR
jgi:anti-sigma regulatory factor (Ser/Thr protein kinase)